MSRDLNWPNLVSKERSWEVATALNSLKLNRLGHRNEWNPSFANSPKVLLLLPKVGAGSDSTDLANWGSWQEHALADFSDFQFFLGLLKIATFLWILVGILRLKKSVFWYFEKPQSSSRFCAIFPQKNCLIRSEFFSSWFYRDSKKLVVA